MTRALLTLGHGTASQEQLLELCSEAVWWRCHRRMIADSVVLARGVPVRHLKHDGQDQDHRLTDVARVTSEGLLVYIDQVGA